MCAFVGAIVVYIFD